eukprot:231083-Chlamydomonas_euryale.AAC.1
MLQPISCSHAAAVVRWGRSAECGCGGSVESTGLLHGQGWGGRRALGEDGAAMTMDQGDGEA